MSSPGRCSRFKDLAGHGHAAGSVSPGQEAGKGARGPAGIGGPSRSQDPEPRLQSPGRANAGRLRPLPAAARSTGPSVPPPPPALSMLGTLVCATRAGTRRWNWPPPGRTRGSAGWPTAGREHGQAQGGQGSSTASIHLGHGPWPLRLSSSLQGRKERCPYNLVLESVSVFPPVLSHPTCVTLSVIPNLVCHPSI